MGSKHEGGRRLAYLDAIRGLAALSVVGNHYVRAFGNPARITASFPFGIWWDGEAAVSIFFILSGFVLSFRHFDGSGTSGERELNYARYIIARVFRIWVPYLAAVLLCVAVYHLRAWQLDTNPPSQAWLRERWADPLTLHTILQDCMLWKFQFPTLITPAWTLSVELIISLLIPAALLISERSSFWLIFVVIVLYRFMHTPIFVIHFAAGMLMAKHYSLEPGSARRRVLFAIILLLSFPLYNIRFLIHQPFAVTEGSWIISGMGALGILWVAVRSQSAQRVLSVPVFAHLGRVSYGLYLLHSPVMICLTPRLLRITHRLGHNSNWLAGFVLTVIVSWILAEVFYRLIEVPSIAAGKQLGRLTVKLPATFTTGSPASSKSKLGLGQPIAIV
jgi:peptidoglycan/LPS O-acetylase OafA/YrhL